MSRERELSPEDWDHEIPWPFHALLAWSLVLVGGFFAVLAVVLQLVSNATSQGGVLARPWPLGLAWAAPAALLVAFASPGVAAWVRAERAVP